MERKRTSSSGRSSHLLLFFSKYPLSLLEFQSPLFPLTLFGFFFTSSKQFERKMRLFQHLDESKRRNRAASSASFATRIFSSLNTSAGFSVWKMKESQPDSLFLFSFSLSFFPSFFFYPDLFECQCKKNQNNHLMLNLFHALGLRLHGTFRCH